jgi:tetratricopeptide (TPR) repeat protein
MPAATRMPAAADYRKAIAADPKQFEARLALGLLLAHQAKFDEAREQLQQATLLRRSRPTRLPRLRPSGRWPSWIAASDPPAARDALVAALKLSPETPADLLLTAQIAEANDDLELAQTAYQRLLASHPAVSASMAVGGDRRAGPAAAQAKEVRRRRAVAQERVGTRSP